MNQASKRTFRFLLVFVLSLFSLSVLLPAPSKVGAVIEERDLKDKSPSETRPSASAETSPATQPSAQKEEGSQDQKGGIHKVGRAFKKAGRGIKKGFVATGRAFKKAGKSIKGAFVGEKTGDDSQNSKPNPSLDHRGDEAETQPIL